MKIYNYHPETFELMSEGFADISPLSPNEFILPQFSTSIAPPEFDEHQIPVFINLEWVLIDDYRGEKVYDKQSLEEFSINTLGKIPDEFTVIEPPNKFCEWDDVQNTWIENTEKHLTFKVNELIFSIRDSAQQEINILDNSYPDFEKLTWQDQEREARAYLKDNSELTPTISAIAQARNIDLFDLANKIVNKADDYRSMAAAIIGKRQRIEDEIKKLHAEKNVDSLYSISW